MIWWCKVRAAAAVVAATAGTVVIGLVVGNVELPIPVLTGQSGQFLLAHLMTLIPAVTVLYGVGRGSVTERVSVRNVRSWDAAYGVCVAAAGLLCALAGYLALDSDLAVVLGRNLAGYIGLALLLQPLLGSQLTGGALAAIPLVLAASGWKAGGAPEPWAWLLHPADSALAGLTALGVVCAGTAVSALWSRPPLRIFDHL
ncbi:hypothetical protein ACFZCG_39265 [Streptomyces tanashiensis]|uniref:hypothetical protein n=1 Tax=Streptomyces tanashiensis TaxID=67367 RepID=UPI0036EF99B3